jgi:hypothetical protein
MVSGPVDFPRGGIHMKSGEKHRVQCCDGIMRTGRVIWLHSRGIFAVLDFGCFREAILLNRSTPGADLPDGHRLGDRYTPEEDEKLLNTDSIQRLAREMGRDPGSLYDRRRRLRKKVSAIV